MKNLNSLFAFILLVLVVAACSSSSNINSNSSNSSNSNSSNSANSNKIDGEDIEWSVDLIKAPKKPVIVLSFAKQGAWEKHQDDIKQLVASIKPTS